MTSTPMIAMPRFADNRRARLFFVIVGVLFLIAAGIGFWKIPRLAPRLATTANQSNQSSTTDPGDVPVMAALARNAQRSQDVLSLEREGLLLAAQNAVANPRLMAAVGAHVDDATFDDLFKNENWWAPYRDKLSVGIAYDLQGLAYAQSPLVSSLPWSPLLAEARAGQTSTALLHTKSHAVLAVAVPASLNNERLQAVLVFVRDMDDAFLSKIVTEIGAPVLLSDGQRALAQASPVKRPGESRTYDWSVAGAALLGKESIQTVDGEATSLGMPARAIPLAPQLWLWVGAQVPHTSLAKQARVSSTLLYTVASILTLLGIYLIFGPRRRKPHADESAALAPTASQPFSLSPTSEALTPEVMPAAYLEGELGRYTLVERLGEGGMAEVFTAVSFGSGGFHRSFVVKRLRPEMRRCPEALSQFIDEANLAASLVHPNIVPVFDFGQAGEDFYLAQEYVPGRDLGRLTRTLAAAEKPRLSVDVLLYITHEILSALQYVHERCDADGVPLQMVHRDVSPENILVSLRGEVRLLDFGIVKATRGNRVSRTELGHVKGNVEFMSPEQAQGKAVDCRSDLFSLGLTIFKCVTGQPLYQGDSIYDKLLAAATGPQDEHFECIDALPEPLNRLLRGVLSVNMDERYASAAAFKQALPPASLHASAELAATVNDMFGADLRAEQKRLASVRPSREVDRVVVSADLLLPAVTVESPKVA